MTSETFERAIRNAGRTIARTKMVNIRLSEDEYAVIADEAGFHDLPVATFMRVVTLAALDELRPKNRRDVRR